MLKNILQAKKVLPNYPNSGMKYPTSKKDVPFFLTESAQITVTAEISRRRNLLKLLVFGVLSLANGLNRNTGRQD
jgi:hypothetical protein